MDKIVLLKSKNTSIQLNKMLENSLQNVPHKISTFSQAPKSIENQKIIFALELNSMGIDNEALLYLQKVYSSNGSFKNSIAAVFIHSENELFTKSFSSQVIFLANMKGCNFLGHPLVEAIENLKNFESWSKILNKSLEDSCYYVCNKLVQRLYLQNIDLETKNICVIHASLKGLSNTLSFWNEIKEKILKINPSLKIEEVRVENGTITDCRGCNYVTCMYYGKNHSCFYGGLSDISSIFSAIEKSDTLIMLCPNYNDSISANLMAVINRMTALYRNISFYDKKLYSIIVSGNSGSDSVAKQLLNALCVNKGFFLPSNFCVHTIAKEVNSIKKDSYFENIIENFANNILSFSNINLYL